MNGIKSQSQTMKNDNRAFTLIETIIGLAIASMIILAVYSFMSVGTQSYEAANQNAKVQEEMQITNNYIEDIIMAGSVAQTKYVDNGNIRMLYVGKKIFYYNKSLKMFAIYEEGESLGDDLEEHLITDCMSDFSVEFLSTELETTSETEDSDEETESDTSEEETTEPEENTTYASSNMVKITTTYAVKKQALNSEKIYMIRNK